MHVISSRVAAGTMALSAFTIAIIAGLASGNDAAQILLRALLAMIACYAIGFAIGLVCEHVVRARAGAEAAAEQAAPLREPQGIEVEEPIVV